MSFFRTTKKFTGLVVVALVMSLLLSHFIAAVHIHADEHEEDHDDHCVWCVYLQQVEPVLLAAYIPSIDAVVFGEVYQAIDAGYAYIFLPLARSRSPPPKTT